MGDLFSFVSNAVASGFVASLSGLGVVVLFSAALFLIVQSYFSLLFYYSLLFSVINPIFSNWYSWPLEPVLAMWAKSR